MPETEGVCNECGFRFALLVEHLGLAICPACGSEDLELVTAGEDSPAT
jgi:anaerobic ribonucleoside-triphosphate reductase